MASPQLKNGFIRIANELLEEWFKHPALGRSARTLLWVIRQTYGFNIKEFGHCIPTARLARDTGMGYRNSRYAVKRLMELGLITKNGLQKDYDQWGTNRSLGTKRSYEQLVPQKVNNSFTSLPIVKTKDIPAANAAEGFDIFWKAYPRKIAKQDALSAWRKIAPSVSEQAAIQEAVRRHSSLPQWSKESGQYVPYPATWLRGRRWEDEETSVNNGTSQTKQRIKETMKILKRYDDA